MTWDHLHREEAPDEERPSTAELHGVAPPCSRCGERERVEGSLCEECMD